MSQEQEDDSNLVTAFEQLNVSPLESKDTLRNEEVKSTNADAKQKTIVTETEDSHAGILALYKTDVWNEEYKSILSTGLYSFPVEILDIVGGYLPAPLRGSCGRVSDKAPGRRIEMVCESGGFIVAVNTLRDEVWLWDSAELTLRGDARLAPLDRGWDGVFSVCDAGDGVVAVGLSGGSIKFVDTQAIAQEHNHFEVGCIEDAHSAQSTVDRLLLLRDGKRLISASDEGVARVWQRGESGRAMATWGDEHTFFSLELQMPSVTSILELEDGKVAFASPRRSITVFDMSTGQQVRRFDQKAILLCRLGNSHQAPMVSMDSDGVITIWDVVSGKPVREIRLPMRASNMTYCGNGCLAVYASGRGKGLEIWDLKRPTLAEGDFRQRLVTGLSDVTSLLYLSTGRLITGGWNSAYWQDDVTSFLEEWK